LDRLEAVQKNLSSLGLSAERFPAYDGATLQELDIINNVPDLIGLYKASGKSGPLACTMSHVILNKLIYERGYEHAIILEDDVVFDLDFRFCAIDVSIMPTGFEVVKLESSMKRPYVLGVPLGTFAGRQLAFLPAHGRNGSAAYLISRLGASKIVKNVPLFGGTFDHVAFDPARSQLKVCHLLPYPARQNGESVIRRMAPDVFGANTVNFSKSKSKPFNPLKTLQTRYLQLYKTLDHYYASYRLLGLKTFNIRPFKTQTARVTRW
jgi:glycosyl transferase family 25